MTPADETDPEGTPGDAAPADEAIRGLITRLARPHRSGGRVIERAALLSAGADFRSAMAWIEAHGGEPEATAPAAPRRGLYDTRPAAADPTPLRFVLPATALR